MPIAQFNGKALVFNNGVVDVVQGDVSLVDSEKVAHIPVSSVNIDNETIIMNANQQLEVPIDEDTIYIDGAGFMKAKQGGSGAIYTAGEHISISSENVISAEWPEVSDHKVILCTKVGEGAAGPIGSFTLNQNSDKTITIPIPEPEVKEYTGGRDIEVTSEGVINFTGSEGGGGGSSISVGTYPAANSHLISGTFSNNEWTGTDSTMYPWITNNFINSIYAREFNQFVINDAEGEHVFWVTNGIDEKGGWSFNESIWDEGPFYNSVLDMLFSDDDSYTITFNTQTSWDPETGQEIPGHSLLPEIQSIGLRRAAVNYINLGTPISPLDNKYYQIMAHNGMIELIPETSGNKN